MSENEGNDGDEFPQNITNKELAKILKEHLAKSKKMEMELERLKQRYEGRREEEECEEEEEEILVSWLERLNIPADQRHFLEALERVGRKDSKPDVPMFMGKMNVEECMDWVEALENYFECDDTPESSKVKVAKSKMKGPTLSWWNFLQNERVENNKAPITTWKRMLAEIKKQFVPEDYEVALHKKLHNLKQKDMDVSTYTEEFHKLTLKTKISETENQKLARYLNGLKYSIQDELSLFNPESVHKCHQMALKIEEKQRKRGEQINRGGRGNQNFRGRGRF